MNKFTNEEMQYCTYCGTINKKSAVECTECGKKIRGEYKPFYDFLKKHTKEELSGSVTDTLFSCLKQFLLSHVYGVALSVTVIAAAASTVYAAQPHVKKVTEMKRIQTALPVQEEVQPQTPITADDLYDFYHLAGNYDAFTDGLRASEPYWAQDVRYYNSADEMYAENNIDGFSYGGVHEMIANPITMHMLDVDPAYEDSPYSHVYTDRYLDNASAVEGEACTTAIAKALLADGYRVAECNYVLCEAEGEYDFETHTGSNVVKKLVYKFVYVEHEGEWYIVEDRLIERVNV